MITQARYIIFMVIVNHQLATAFRRRNTSVLTLYRIHNTNTYVTGVTENQWFMSFIYSWADVSKTRIAG